MYSILPFRDDLLLIAVGLIVVIAVTPLGGQMAQTVAASCTVDHPSLFDRARVDEAFRPVIISMLQWSPTFRRQCQRLIEADHLTLIVRMAWPIRPYPVRTTFRRTSAGALEALVDVTFSSSRQPEAIAHELEHVIEQLDGVDVPALARRGLDAHEIQAGLFETDRALRAGRTAAHELWAGHRGPRREAHGTR